MLFSISTETAPFYAYLIHIHKIKNPVKYYFTGIYLLIEAERQGFEPTTLTAYISATLLSKFQIGNETVTIFRRWACPTLTAVCLPNFRVQR